MGVKKLWQIIKPSARTIKPESLKHRRLAIDASIWLVSFVKAMKDANGNIMHNAHLKGLWGRILKLLFYGIKPVFVFDGSPPALKSETMQARRQSRIRAETQMQKIAEKILLNQLKLNTITQAKKMLIEGKIQLEEALKATQTLASFSVPSSTPVNQTQNDFANTPSSLSDKNHLTKSDEIEIAVDEQSVGELDLSILSSGETSVSLRPSHSTHSFTMEELRELDVNNEKLQNLTAEEQVLILKDMKSAHSGHVGSIAASSNRRISSDNYSTMQVDQLVQRGVISRRLEEVRNSIENTNYKQIASDPSIVYKLVETNKSHSVESIYDLIFGRHSSNTADASGTKLLELTANTSSSAAAKHILPSSTKFGNQQQKNNNDLKTSHQKKNAPAAQKEDVKKLILMFPFEDPEMVTLSSADEDDEDDDDDSNFGDEEEDTQIDQEASKTVNFDEDQRPSGVVILDDELEDEFGDTMFEDYIPDSNTPQNPQRQMEEVQEIPDSPPVLLQYRQDSTLFKDSPNNSSLMKENPLLIPNQQMEEQNNEEKSMEIKPNSESPSFSNFRRSTASDIDNPYKESSQLANSKESPLSFSAIIPIDPLSTTPVASQSDDSITLSVNNTSSSFFRSDSRPENSEEGNTTPQTHTAGPTKATTVSQATLPLHTSLMSSQSSLAINRSQLSAESEEKHVSKPTLAPAIIPATISSQVPAVTASQATFSKKLPDDLDLSIDSQSHPSMNQSIMSEEERRNPLRGMEMFENLEAELQRENVVLENQARMEQNIATNLSSEASEEAKELLRLFGIPYVQSPGEADAQCALLQKMGLVDGIISDDSDILVFGGTTVFRYAFSHHKELELYNIEDLQADIGLTSKDIIFLALLLGGDYADGIQKVGPKFALEIVKEFPTPTSFKEWLTWYQKTDSSDNITEDPVIDDSIIKPSPKFVQQHAKTLSSLKIPESFPHPAVLDAYINPIVDQSDVPFSWGWPSLAELRSFAQIKFGWALDRIDSSLVPILQKYTAVLSDKQPRIETFFNHISIHGRNFQKKRQRTMSKKKKKTIETEDEEHQQNEAQVGKPPRKKKKGMPAIEEEESQFLE